MRTGFCATMRSPAASIMALIASVRLRRVASGLMIEKVRSIAISFFLLWREPSELGVLITALSVGSKARRCRYGVPAAGWIVPGFAAIPGQCFAAFLRAVPARRAAR